MKILIIAGHGQGDPGACACGYEEATLAREYAPMLKAALSKYADVTLYDTSKNMYKQLKAGNSFNFKNYNYVVELHFNAGVNNQGGNGYTTGTEILVHPSESGTTVEQAILNNICALGFKNRGVKVRTDLLNMNTCKGKQGVSYALIETCFIDDLDDMKLYQAKKQEVVNAIANGIATGFGLAASNSAPATPQKKMLESANDITWELNHSFFPILEVDNFVKALDAAKKAGSPLYWGYYKLVNRL